MATDFLLTSAAGKLTLASAPRMNDEEAERVFIRLRWADNHGDAYCPRCGYLTVYASRRPNGALRSHCKAPQKDGGACYTIPHSPGSAAILCGAYFFEPCVAVEDRRARPGEHKHADYDEPQSIEISIQSADAIPKPAAEAKLITDQAEPFDAADQ
jgi:hypothetical protein